MKIQSTIITEQDGAPVVQILFADGPDRETAKEWIEFRLKMPEAPDGVSLGDLREEALRRAQKALTPETKDR